jgi:hypothetical protein
MGRTPRPRNEQAKHMRGVSLFMTKVGILAVVVHSPNAPMLKYRLSRNYSVLRYLLLALVLLFFAAKPADAHFFGAAKEIDGYQVIFAPYPENPAIGEDSTLNFSVLEGGANLFNVHAAVKVQDSSTGELVLQEPYRQYEISDITVPYVFAQAGDYTVTIETRIPEHEKYQSQPLVATFDISVFSGPPLDELLIYYVAPATAAAAGIVVYLHSKKMI